MSLPDLKLLDLTRTVHAIDFHSRRVSLLDVLKDTRCSVPSCRSADDGGPGLASIAILNAVNSGAVVLVGSRQSSTIYLCESHLQEDGEAEADTLAELTRGGPVK